MTTITIPLDKNPEVAQLLSDKEMGDCIYGCFTVKSVDGQTAVLRIKDMADSPDDLAPADNPAEEDAETDDGPAEEKMEKQSPEGAEEEMPKPSKAGKTGADFAAMLSGGGGSGY